MKHLKILGLLALAVTAMMAFSANASATKLTSPTGTEYSKGRTIKGTAGQMKMTGAFTTVTCETSTFEGTITASGGTAVEVSLSTLDFNTCNFTVTVTKIGTWSLTAISAGNEVKGTFKSTGTEIDVSTSLGTCVFTTNGTDMGTFTGGKTASKDISAVIPRTAGNFLCGSTGTWEGSYSIVTPDELWLDS